MVLPRKHGKALENLVSPIHKKKATSNQGLVKVLKHDGTTLYGLWQRSPFSHEPPQLLFLSEPGSMSLSELNTNPNIRSYHAYQLRDKRLQREFQKAIIKRHLNDQPGLAPLLEPLVYSGHYKGDQYLKLLAYLAVIKPQDSLMAPQSISESTNSDDFSKIVDKNLKDIERLLAINNDCPIRVKPHEASYELENIMFEPVEVQ